MKNKIINIIGGVLIVASLVFIARRFEAMDVNWHRLFAPSTLALIIIMPFLSVTIIFLNSFCWKCSLMLFVDRQIHSVETYVVYSKANIAKYLPGNVGHYVARQMFGAQMELRQLHLVLASLFEIGYSLLSMLVVSLLFYARAVFDLLQEQFGTNVFLWGGIIFIALAIALVILCITLRENKYIDEIIKLAVKPRFWLTMLRSSILSVVSVFVIGMMFVIIMCQYITLDLHGTFLLLGGSAASHFIGFVTPGVPGGIGVREAVMLLLLAPFFPSEVILLAAMVQRVIMIIGDICSWLIGIMLSK